MEELGILVDVSHLNDEGFADLCKVATKPFICLLYTSEKVIYGQITGGYPGSGPESTGRHRGE